MLLTEIKEYLQGFHLELDKKILDELVAQKSEAVSQNNEALANELWCLVETYNAQNRYLNMFKNLKAGKYEHAWGLLVSIDVSLGNLKANFGEEINEYHLNFIDDMIKNYEKLFPYKLFFSREGIIKSERCSICGKTISLRNSCGHIPGKLYMGELCLREVTDYELVAISLVRNPMDKYAVVKVNGQEYNYEILDRLMPKLTSPFTPWYLEEQRKEKLESGLHYRIIMPVEEMIKEEKSC